MPKLKEGTIIPTAAETVAIYAGIAADSDTFELTDEEFSRLKPMPMRGRPPASRPKIHTGLRLDEDVLMAFKMGGRGWQTRINAALKEWLKTHPATM